MCGIYPTIQKKYDIIYGIYRKWECEIMIDISKVACFSGHRKLPQDCGELRAKLKKEIIGLIERGVVFFGAGGALG